MERRPPTSADGALPGGRPAPASVDVDVDVEVGELDFDAERVLDDVATDEPMPLDAPLEAPAPDLIDQRRSVTLDEDRER